MNEYLLSSISPVFFSVGSLRRYYTVGTKCWELYLQCTVFVALVLVFYVHLGTPSRCCDMMARFCGGEVAHYLAFLDQNTRSRDVGRQREGVAVVLSIAMVDIASNPRSQTKQDGIQYSLRGEQYVLLPMLGHINLLCVVPRPPLLGQYLVRL